MKIILIALSLASMIGLTACSHENPLEKEPEESMVHFLRDSSEYAAKKMKYSGSWGDAYLYCIEGDLNKNPGFCPKLYKYMVEYAGQSGSRFKGLTVEDLTNKQFFDHRVRNSAYVFNSIPFD